MRNPRASARYPRIPLDSAVFDPPRRRDGSNLRRACLGARWMALPWAMAASAVLVMRCVGFHATSPVARSPSVRQSRRRTPKLRSERVTIDTKSKDPPTTIARPVSLGIQRLD